jgi:hypothetical protein
VRICSATSRGSRRMASRSGSSSSLGLVDANSGMGKEYPFIADDSICVDRYRLVGINLLASYCAVYHTRIVILCDEFAA